MKLTEPTRPTRTGPRMARLATLAALLAALLPCAFSQPAAADGTTLERPTFDRATGAVLVPFHGTVPRIHTEEDDGGTRLIVTFPGSTARLPAPYKLGVFHPLVQQIVMTPDPSRGEVDLTIMVSQPSHVAMASDARGGMLRMQILDGAGNPVTLADAAPQAAYAPPQAPQAPVPSMRPWSPDAPAPHNVAIAPPNLPPTPPAPPPYRPYTPPSAPPVGYANGSPLVPGTPTSGDYVYRKVVPDSDGHDVTEIEVRTAHRSAVEVAQDAGNGDVKVEVASHGIPPEGPAPEGWMPLGLRDGPAMRPVAALDAYLGYALMSERATQVGSTNQNLGTNFSGSGASLVGVAGHWPFGPTMNLSLAAQTFSYNIQSAQVPGAQDKRDEYFVQLLGEYLPVREPWVLAIGPGYWLRYVRGTSNVLAPPTPSLAIDPAQLQHGPALNARVYFPLLDTLGLAADAGLAPFLFGDGSSVAQAIGPTYGYSADLALKWANRHVSASLGYTQLGFGNYAGGYLFNRGGPEVSFVWRF